MSGSGGAYLSPEDQARVKIDRSLVQAGWVVQSSDMVNLGAGRGVAVREFILLRPHGRPDYLLYLDRKPVGAIEAKPDGTTLTEVERQSSRYSGGLPEGIEAPVQPLPFIYESTGVETRFTNLSDPEPRSRPVFSFHRPVTLARWVRGITERPSAPTLLARLQQLPPVAQGDLWEVQTKAVRNIEKSLRDNKPRTLVQMTTGSGKTFTAAHLCHRLIRHADAARILFLVDRSTLGIQTEGEFQGFTVTETGRKFTQEYGVQRLTHNRIDPSARVCISTIQRMYSILCGDAEMSPELDNQSADSVAPRRAVEVGYNQAVPPETFDLVIIDECHRSIYTVWRQVVEYFDAYLIGLTATPSKATYGFFRRNVVMEYSHADAVVDNVNVDYSVYNIRTTITEQGSTIPEGEWAGFRKKKDRTMRWEQLDEPKVYFNKDLDRRVVTLDQIRTVIHTFRDKVFTEIFPGRSAVPKTLIFAKTDSHADDVVQIIREEFNRGNEFAQKITYRTTDGDPEVLLAAFRNSPNPRIVVTVDMIATGTDVKPIECLLFMRDVRSRTYFEQMLGRGVRVIDDTAFQAVTPDPTAKSKDHFVVVDAVGVLSSRFVDSVQPLERKPKVPSEKILKDISYGGALDPDEASSLASRLLKLELQIKPADRDRLRELSGGVSLQQIAADIVAALDPDRQRDAAALETGQSDPTPQNVTRVGKAMLEIALRPLADNPDLRQAILDLGRELDQTIDEISLDTLIEAGYSTLARERAEALTRDFRRFIDEHRDEIHALQVLYSRPYRDGLTLDAVKELSAAMERPPHRWTRERLWRAYDLLDRSKVRGSGERRLADIVSLVRYALQQEDELVPFEETAQVRFESWLAMQEQQGAIFTPDQRTWLEWMRDVIATDLGISDVALDYPPFLTHGGLPRALQMFGERLRPLMEDLTETLTA